MFIGLALAKFSFPNLTQKVDIDVFKFGVAIDAIFDKGVLES